MNQAKEMVTPMTSSGDARTGLESGFFIRVGWVLGSELQQGEVEKQGDVWTNDVNGTKTSDGSCHGMPGHIEDHHPG